MARRNGSRARAFSLIDLLVSIAVMAVLISILLPVLGRAQESARRVLCANNMRHIGIAVNMYADDFIEHLPPATGLQELREATMGTSWGNRGFEDPLPEYQADTMQARSMMASPGRMSNGFRYTLEPGTTERPRWEGIGNLVHQQYLSHPEACYCPSHRGRHAFTQYRATWLGRSGTIYTNFQYRIPGSSPYRQDLAERTIIMTDGMETKLDYNHIKGSNTLMLDSSVGWFDDTEGVVYDSLPDGLEMGAGGADEDADGSDRTPAWRELESQASRRRR